MLSPADNELLTRVSPGTPMGNFMRQYWVPAAAASELPFPGCPPLRVMLLGEKLIAFRSKDGTLGLVDELCPHRRANLFYGRVEDDGIRCVYHGWKFGADGKCSEIPSEPEGVDFKDRITTKHYPCVERSGIIWTYMGQRKRPPPLPDLEANELPKEEWDIPLEKSEGILGLRLQMRNCNWLQAMENELDTTHQVFLHLGHEQAEDAEHGTMRRISFEQRAPHWETAEMDYGSMSGAYRRAGPEQRYWRIAQYLFPFYSMSPINLLGKYVGVRAWVPMDDHHSMSFTCHGAMAGFVSAKKDQGPQMTFQPNTPEWFGRFRPTATAENDYGINRKLNNYTGIHCVGDQDQMVTETMDPIVDRTKEHLGTSDSGVIAMRRRLLRVVKTFVDDPSVAPPGVDNPEVYRQRSGGIILNESEDWITATEQRRKAYVTHEIDESVRGGFI